MKKLYLIVLCVILYSCSTSKTLNLVKLREDTKIASHKDYFNHQSKRLSQVQFQLAPKGTKVKIELEEEKLRFIFDNKNKLTNPLASKNKPAKNPVIIKTNLDFEIEQEASYRLADHYLYKDILNKKGKPNLLENLIKKGVSNISEAGLEFSKSITLKYSDHKPTFQTLTIPFKLRGETSGLASTVSTGVNVGLAYGYQWNYISVEPIYSNTDFKMKGYDKKKTSFTAAPFLGLTTIALTPKNTEETIESDKTVMGISFGGTSVFSFNKLNLGLAIGLDYGFSDSKNWVYQGKPWVGIVFGLDIIK